MTYAFAPSTTAAAFVIGSSSSSLEDRRFTSNRPRVLTSLAESSSLNPAEIFPASFKDDDMEEDAMEAEEADDDYDDDTSSATMSKLRWKKKVYLLLKGVSARIRRQDKNALRHVEEAVRRMEYWYDRVDHQNNSDPSSSSSSTSSSDAISSLWLQAYNLWIHAIAKSYQPMERRGPQAEKILRQLQKTTRHSPNVVTFTSVMDAYAQQARVDRDAPAQAERILFEWIEETETLIPDSSGNTVTSSVTLDTVLNAWAQQGTLKGARRAQEILERLEALSAASGGNRNYNASIRPSAHSYASVITAFAKSRGGRASAEQAQALLDRMLEQQQDKSRQAGSSAVQAAVRPDTVVFNAVLHAWATSGDPQAGTKAVAILNQMKELSSQNKKYHECRPDTVTYNTVLSCFSHSGHVRAAAKAEQILKVMLEAHQEDPKTAPAATTTTYNNVLHAWSRSKLDGAAGRAQQLLNYMIRSDQSDISPDVYSFTSVLDSLAKSKEPDKAVKSRKLLMDLLDLYETTRDPSLKPSQVPFNAVLNAAAFSAMGTSKEEQRAALQVAVQTFSLMRSKGYNPDMISYGNLLKAFANLMPPGPTRTNMALKIFGHACEEGYVGDLVWKEAQRAIPAKKLKIRLDGIIDAASSAPISSLQVRDLPAEWKRNLRSAKSRSSAHKYKPKKTNKRKKKQGQDEAEKPKLTPPARRFRNISETSWQSGRDM